MSPQLNLLVLRVDDVDRSRTFYESLGLMFVAERHGNGPEHFSSTLGETVLELYPRSSAGAISTIRLGFAVDDLASVQARAVTCGGVEKSAQSTLWGLRAVLIDPDGNRVVVVQRTRASTDDAPERRSSVGLE